MRLRILKPADGRTWAQLGQLLYDVRYRVFRLANLALSENYLAFHLFRSHQAQTYTPAKIAELNKRLKTLLLDEQKKTKDTEKEKPGGDPIVYSKNGALPDAVVGALSQYKIKGLATNSKWSQVVRGKTSLPTFRNDMAIPVRCDKPGYRRLEQTPGGDVELDLIVCLQPYPRVMLATKDKKIGDGARAILERLLANREQSEDGYRQRVFEIKKDRQTGKWWLYVAYDFPATPAAGLREDVVVGVDVGVSCPLYAAISNGHARLGRRAFGALGARIRSLQRQVMARRRDIQRGGRDITSRATARSGHGRKRKLQPIEKLEGRINNAYTTLNHQLSAAVVQFALDHGAGVMQIENLTGLAEKLSGTFIGASWRYHQLQAFLDYKAKEKGIVVRKVDPRYTSRRCSACGTINADFDRKARDEAARPGFSARFHCLNPDCEYATRPADADYNAARNLATLDIERRVRQQCKTQGLKFKDEEALDAAAESAIL
jgi:IS605 OrfB family transposase